jgi:hypothetical protein
MLGIEEAGVRDLTTTRLKDKQVWADLIEAFDAVISNEVDGPARQLEFLRFLPPGADERVSSDVCRMLGFDLSQDVLNMSAEKFTHLSSQLGMYPDTNGTDDFTKFIGLMTNGHCFVEYLWTEDYINFYLEPKGLTLEKGGRWFKTTHVYLNMGFSTLDGLQLKENQTLGQKILEIFFQQAPTTLVVERQIFTVALECQPIGFGATVLGAERIYEVEL